MSQTSQSSSLTSISGYESDSSSLVDFSDSGEINQSSLVWEEEGKESEEKQVISPPLEISPSPLPPHLEVFSKKEEMSKFPSLPSFPYLSSSSKDCQPTYPIDMDKEPTLFKSLPIKSHPPPPLSHILREVDLNIRQGNSNSNTNCPTLKNPSSLDSRSNSKALNLNLNSSLSSPNRKTCTKNVKTTLLSTEFQSSNNCSAENNFLPTESFMTHQQNIQEQSQIPSSQTLDRKTQGSSQKEILKETKMKIKTSLVIQINQSMTTESKLISHDASDSIKVISHSLSDNPTDLKVVALYNLDSNLESLTSPNSSFMTPQRKSSPVNSESKSFHPHSESLPSILPYSPANSFLSLPISDSDDSDRKESSPENLSDLPPPPPTSNASIGFSKVDFDTEEPIKFGPVTPELQALIDFDDLLSDLFVDNLHLTFQTMKMTPDYFSNLQSHQTSSNLEWKDWLSKFNKDHHSKEDSILIPLTSGFRQFESPKFQIHDLTGDMKQRIRVWTQTQIQDGNNKSHKKSFSKIVDDLTSLCFGESESKPLFTNQIWEAFKWYHPYFQSMSHPARSKKVFKKHVSFFSNIYTPFVKWNVMSTNAYGMPQACIKASDDFKRGERIEHLVGVLAEVAPGDLCKMYRRHSIMNRVQSGKIKSTHCLLGPARFVNHDCEPNCEFVSSADNTVTFVAKVQISKGDEILVHYGEGYFSEWECRCSSCNRRREREENKSHPSESIQTDVALLANLGRMRNATKRKKLYDELCFNPLDVTCFQCQEGSDLIPFREPSVCYRCDRHFKIFHLRYPYRARNQEVADEYKGILLEKWNYKEVTLTKEIKPCPPTPRLDSEPDFFNCISRTSWNPITSPSPTAKVSSEITLDAAIISSTPRVLKRHLVFASSSELTGGNHWIGIKVPSREWDESMPIQSMGPDDVIVRHLDPTTNYSYGKYHSSSLIPFSTRKEPYLSLIMHVPQFKDRLATQLALRYQKCKDFELPSGFLWKKWQLHRQTIEFNKANKLLIRAEELEQRESLKRKLKEQKERILIAPRKKKSQVKLNLERQELHQKLAHDENIRFLTGTKSDRVLNYVLQESLPPLYCSTDENLYYHYTDLLEPSFSKLYHIAVKGFKSESRTYKVSYTKYENWSSRYDHWVQESEIVPQNIPPPDPLSHGVSHETTLNSIGNSEDSESLEKDFLEINEDTSSKDDEDLDKDSKVLFHEGSLSIPFPSTTPIPYSSSSTFSSLNVGLGRTETSPCWLPLPTTNPKEDDWNPEVEDSGTVVL